MSSAEASEGESLAMPGDDYARLRLDLARAVRRLCPAWLASRTEDIVQNALIRVRRIVERSATPPDLALSYLRRVAYSALVDEIRVLRRRQEVPLEVDDGQQFLQSSDPGPERILASREIGQGILDCLRRLKRKRRLALTLFLQGHTVPEAALILGWSAKVTENLVYRGRSDLRLCLAGKGLTP